MTDPFSPLAIAKLRGIRPGSTTPLDPTGRFGRAAHFWSEPEINALMLAVAAGRPLLVKGEPGTGKTQLARAAAVVLSFELHHVAIHARYEPQELMVRFDAVGRLARAQRGGAALTRAEERRFWTPGPLWLALDWKGAQGYGRSGKPGGAPPEGHVVLIDEIDKAETDLANALLDVLAQRSFRIEALGLDVGTGAAAAMPLIIVTSNDERELPDAFVRRCMVLTLAPPEGQLEAWLRQRVRAQRDASVVADRVLDEAIAQLNRERAAAQQGGRYRPGLAELLDLVSALAELAPADPAKQLAWLEKTRRYALGKSTAADEGRTADGA